MSQESPQDADKQSWEYEEAPWIEKDGVEDANDRYGAYTPQLMDTYEMHELRTALNRSEMQIQQQGHMREYVPRKPTSSRLRRWYGLPRNHQRQTMSAGPSSRLKSSETNANNQPRERPSTSRQPTRAGIKDFTRTLREEARQVRELEQRYEETKRSLLEYIEVVSSCKPNDRVGGQDVYEQLADLISFAAQCSTSE
ncbi:hypothetical protein V7S43_014839 [Phytophthora oleae]|uniref:Uncharacterized protein n=1 Tax=Phytophthora oleae TaxID=2107226 RepID=A0ABD3F3S9_9STRA